MGDPVAGMPEMKGYGVGAETWDPLAWPWP